MCIRDSSGTRPALTLGAGCPSTSSAFTRSSESSRSDRPGGLSLRKRRGTTHEALEVTFERGVTQE
eukprot:7028869-Alexandrium_andersonii.AAC.1